MNGARRLLTAEPVPHYRDNRCDSRGHTEAGEDDQRKQHEDDAEVREPLDDVVRQRLFFSGPLPAQFVPNDTRDAAPGEISLARQQILAEVLREEAGEDVKQARQDANPGREEMQITAPARMAYHERNREIDERRSPQGACFAPIETRVSDENGDAADEQAKETERRDPMSDADGRGVLRRSQAFRALDREPWKVGGLRHNRCCDHSTEYCRAVAEGDIRPLGAGLGFRNDSSA